VLLSSFFIGVILLDTEIQEKHIQFGIIAASMSEWEGLIADELGLTVHDTACIKKKYDKELNLQM
jgi:hypothetical protein